MKRKAIIIGCSGTGAEYLPGVKKDVENYTSFLKSDIGGKWYDSEIISLLDQSKYSIDSTVRMIKGQNNDYVFVVFSGHGDYSTAYDCRRLYTDNTNFIYEKDLWGISKKQLLIVDTCAGKVNDIEQPITRTMAFAESYKAYRKDYRREYERAITNCLDQEINLYACDVDEFSSDTSKGGLFSKSILETAYSNDSQDVLSSLFAHDIASEIVSKKSRNKQNPQYFCSVRRGEKLPFSLRR